MADQLAQMLLALGTPNHKEADLEKSPESVALVEGGLLRSLIKSNRSYFSISELAQKWETSEEALYDLAMQGLLIFSAPAVGWRICKGKLLQTDGEENEIVEEEKVTTGFVSLPRSAIIPLINMRECVVEELWAPDGQFARVVRVESQPLPKLLLANVKITVTSAELLLKELWKQSQEATEQPAVTSEIVSRLESSYTPLITNAIADIFKLVKDDPDSGDKANKAQWRQYAHHASRNGLESARAPRPSDQGRKQSLFYPDLVGEWLVANAIRPRDWVDRKLEKLLSI
jgi:hypothetical protein